MSEEIIKKKNLLLITILFFITLGFYFLSWLYFTNKEMKKNYPKAPYVNTIPIILILSFSYNTLLVLSLMLKILILSLALFVAMFPFIFVLFLWFLIYFILYTIAASKITKKNIIVPIPILLFIFIPVLGGLISMLYMQNKFNKLETKLQTQNSNFPTELNIKEKNGKEYIERYKNEYSKESLKKVLIEAGNSESDVNEWLNKYF